MFATLLRHIPTGKSIYRFPSLILVAIVWAGFGFSAWFMLFLLIGSISTTLFNAEINYVMFILLTFSYLATIITSFISIAATRFAVLLPKHLRWLGIWALPLQESPNEATAGGESYLLYASDEEVRRFTETTHFIKETYYLSSLISSQLYSYAMLIFWSITGLVTSQQAITWKDLAAYQINIISKGFLASLYDHLYLSWMNVPTLNGGIPLTLFEISLKVYITFYAISLVVRVVTSRKQLSASLRSSGSAVEPIDAAITEISRLRNAGSTPAFGNGYHGRSDEFNIAYQKLYCIDREFDLKGSRINFEKAALLGDSWAATELALLYKKGLAGSIQYHTAMQWYRLAATMGDPSAIAVLASLEGDKDRKTKLSSEFISALGQSIKSGEAWGSHELGLVYAVGSHGIAKDCAKALELFKFAASNGERRSHYDIGLIYENGEDVDVDLTMARRSYEIGAGLREKNCLLRAAVFMDEGRGGECNFDGAAGYLLSAARHGSQNARMELDGSLENWKPETRKALKKMLGLAPRNLWWNESDWSTYARMVARRYWEEPTTRNSHQNGMPPQPLLPDIASDSL